MLYSPEMLTLLEFMLVIESAIRGLIQLAKRLLNTPMLLFLAVTGGALASAFVSWLFVDSRYPDIVGFLVFFAVAFLIIWIAERDTERV